MDSLGYLVVVMLWATVCAVGYVTLRDLIDLGGDE